MFTKLLKNSVAVGVLTLAFSFNANAGYVVQYENSLGDAKRNDSYGNSLFLQYGEKINDQWKFNIQTFNSFTLNSYASTLDPSLEKDRMSFTHVYVRTNFQRSQVFSVGNNPVGLGFRYQLPTSAAKQDARSLGIASVRPDMNFQLSEKASLYMQVAFAVDLARARMSFNGKGNDHFIAQLLMAPTIEVTPYFEIAGEFVFNNTMSTAIIDRTVDGKTEKAIHSFYWSNKLSSEIEFALKGELLKGGKVGLVVGSEGRLYGSGLKPGAKPEDKPSPKVFSASAYAYSLRFTKEF